VAYVDNLITARDAAAAALAALDHTLTDYSTDGQSESHGKQRTDLIAEIEKLNVMIGQSQARGGDPIEVRSVHR
jgi:hypothetical protein